MIVEVWAALQGKPTGIIALLAKRLKAMGHARRLSPRIPQKTRSRTIPPRVDRQRPRDD